MNSHLVTVEVGVEGRADEWMDLDGASVDEDRFKRLNTQSVQRRCAVKQNRALLDDFVENVPHFGTGSLNYALGGLNVVGQAASHQAVHNERFEKLQGHALRQAALVQLQLRTNHDDGAPGVVHALAKQVLTEAALLAFQHV